MHCWAAKQQGAARAAVAGRHARGGGGLQERPPVGCRHCSARLLVLAINRPTEGPTTNPLAAFFCCRCRLFVLAARGPAPPPLPSPPLPPPTPATTTHSLP
jgi:hypothetical protein